MRVIFVTSAPLSVWRGVEQFVDRVARDLAEHGSEVRVLACVSERQREAEWRRGKNLRYDYRFIQMPKSLYSFLPILSLGEFSALEQADLYYVTFIDPIFLLFLSTRRKPIVLGLHGVTNLQGQGMRILEPALGLLKSRLTIHALNHNQRQLFDGLGYKVWHLPSAVPDELLVQRLGANASFQVWFASMERFKGADRLIELATLSSRHLSEIKFVVTGAGRMEQDLRNAAAELGNITIKRGLTQEELVDVFSSSNLFLSLSRSESFSRAAAEAQVNGLPAVATPTDGLCDILTDDSFGLLMDYEGIRYLDAIRAYYSIWMTDSLAYLNLKKEIARRQRARFSWETMLRKFEATLRNLSKHPGIDSTA